MLQQSGDNCQDSRISKIDNDQQNSVSNWENYVCDDGSVFYAEFVNINKNCNLFNSKQCQQIAKDEKEIYPDVVEVKIPIDPSSLVLYGSELSNSLTPCECLLGFSTSTYSNGYSLIVSEIMHNSVIQHEKSVKIGYWFKSINDIEVNIHNLYKILSQFTKPDILNLKFESISRLEKTNMIMRINNFENFSTSAWTLLQNKSIQGNFEHCFSLIILSIPFGDDLSMSTYPIFAYPKKENNQFYLARGCFVTLNSILKTEFNTEPKQTKLFFNKTECTVTYCFKENFLLLISISSDIASSMEIELHASQILQYIHFNYDMSQMKNSTNMQNHFYQSCRIFKVLLLKSNETYVLDEIMNESQHISLPKKSLLEIYDALNELEAMDYRDWNDDPLSSHREYFIYGSALFYQSFLIANKMSVKYLKQVESALRYGGIFDFVQNQNVQDFIYWKKVQLNDKSKEYFLVICSRYQLILTVLLEAFQMDNQSSDASKSTTIPSLFYIEEIQDTLDYLYKGGIEMTSKICFNSNKRPESVNGFMANNTNQARRKIRVRTISKRSSSIGPSEDSNKEDSDSDWDGFPSSHRSSNSVYDASEKNKPILKNISNVLPVNITAGKDNALLHYIHIDYGSAMIITSLGKSKKFLIEEFKSACQMIHDIFKNTKTNNSNLNDQSDGQQMKCIKEHGILLSVPISDGENIEMWAIGRKFEFPKRELYICHKSGLSQNMVEIAFRLAFLIIE